MCTTYAHCIFIDIDWKGKKTVHRLSRGKGRWARGAIPWCWQRSEAGVQVTLERISAVGIEWAETLVNPPPATKNREHGQ